MDLYNKSQTDIAHAAMRKFAKKHNCSTFAGMRIVKIHSLLTGLWANVDIWHVDMKIMETVTVHNSEV